MVFINVVYERGIMITVASWKSSKKVDYNWWYKDLYAYHALMKSDPDVMKDMEAFVPRDNDNRMVQEEPQKLQQELP